MYYVKNTILNRLVNSLIPHYCCSCGVIGSVFCDSCKYDIVSEPFDYCIACLKSTSANALCARHNFPYHHAIVAGWRIDGLERLIDVSKFESIKDGCRSQAEVLAAKFPRFIEAPIIVPVPTIRPHIRRRGYGHAELIAQHLSDITGYPTEQPLVRIKNHVQHGAPRIARQRQAAEAFRLERPVKPSRTYIIIDDVYTTGATMNAAAKILNKAGVHDIWVAVTARQPTRGVQKEISG